MTRNCSAPLVGSLPKAMFLLMPFFAGLLLLFFRRQENLYVPHLYASIHLHAFVFFIFSVAIVLSMFRSTLDERPGLQAVVTLLLAMLLLTPVPYYFLSLRRLYGQTWTRTILKGLALGILYDVFLIATMMAVVVYTVLQL